MHPSSRKMPHLEDAPATRIRGGDSSLSPAPSVEGSMIRSAVGKATVSLVAVPGDPFKLVRA
jgi:hypothetical protein